MGALIACAALWIAGPGQDDKARKILVARAESIRDPGSHGRVTTETVPGVDLETGRRVIHRLDLSPAIKADVVDVVLEVSPFR